MSAMDVDKALDEIIETRGTNKRGRRVRRGGAGGAAPAAATNGARARYAGAAPAAKAKPAAMQQPVVKQAAAEAYKVIVSNMPNDVSEASIRELFVTTVGPVRECSLAYDSKGKSKGISTVIFSRKGDAQKAFDMYNSRMIDARRPLKIEVVVDPSKVPLASRVAPLAVPVTQAVRGGVARRGTARGGARGGRGGAAAGTGAGSGKRPQKTEEQLDAEMNDYLAKRDDKTV